MKLIMSFALSAATLTAVLLFSCTMNLAGNSSEVTNGYCVAEAGPVDSAQVVAYPGDYLPTSPSVIPETTFTDTKGHFSMRLGKGAWNLVVYDRDKTIGAFVPLASSDSTIDSIFLKHLGSISGVVNDTIGVPRAVGIVGSPFYANVIGKTDSFAIKKLPPNYYSVSIWHMNLKVSASGPGTTPNPDFTQENTVFEGSVRNVIVVSDSASVITIGP